MLCAIGQSCYCPKKTDGSIITVSTFYVIANQIVSFLDPSSDSASIFEQLQEGRSTLVNEGFNQISTWQEAADGIRPPVPVVQEPGE